MRGDKELERAAREGTLEVDLAEVRRQWVSAGHLHQAVHEAAELYGVFADLFGHAHFWPALPLHVSWPQEGGTCVPAHRGNLVKAREVRCAPEVAWGGGAGGGLWTLALVAPDSHLGGGGEVLLWLVANIEGGSVEGGGGDTLAEYLAPHPARGTGFHRLVFLLYRQEAAIDLGQHRLASSTDLQERTFSTLDFYRC